jgi:hypothetical protein
MKRVFSTISLAAALGFAVGLLACSEDSTSPGAGSVSGKVTFEGEWPPTGDVQVSIFSNLEPPDYAPTGAPDGFTSPIAPNTTEYNYELGGLDNGSYAGILVSWREAANPSGARMLGMYWIHPDSVGIESDGLTAKSPGPKTIAIKSSSLKHTGLDIKADLDLAP